MQATYNHHHRSSDIFAAHHPRSEKQDDNGDGHRRNRNGKLGIILVNRLQNHNPLDTVAEEEEKVELENRNVHLSELVLRKRASHGLSYLIEQIATLHAQIGTDGLVNGPGELLIEFPSGQAQQQGAAGKDANHGERDGVELLIGPVIDGAAQLTDSVAELDRLHGAVCA
jgi:hypothetical protein